MKTATLIELQDNDTWLMSKEFIDRKNDAPWCLFLFKNGRYYSSFAEDALAVRKLMGFQMKPKKSPVLSQETVLHELYLEYTVKFLTEAGYEVKVVDDLSTPARA